jgi:hypothetical protein
MRLITKFSEWLISESFQMSKTRRKMPIPVEVEQLAELYDSGKALRLQIAGWKKMSDTTGQTFLTLKLTMPFEPKRQNQFERDDESDSDDVFADF